jgi:hypothetical protein
MHTFKKIVALVAIPGITILSGSCVQKKKFDSPQGYDLNNPQKILMPEDLHEISGFFFYHGNPDTIYAEQDEAGRLYYFKPGDRQAASCKFDKKGDYEDVALCNNYVVLLRGDGQLFSFPFSDIHNEETTNTKDWDNVLPKGKYEGLYADETNSLLYVLCKHCSDEKTSETGKGFILQLANDGSITPKGGFEYNVRDIESMTGSKKIKFHPSALGKNPLTREWYIVSSVNKMLVIADSTWKVKQTFNLDPSQYIQPEGIALDKNNKLYISNEGGDIHAGNVLKISYSAK